MRAPLAPGRRGEGMTFRRPRLVAAKGQWAVRYQLEIEAAPFTEFYDTKQMARDRYFTLRKAKGLETIALYGPDGKLWFRDRYFGETSYAK